MHEAEGAEAARTGGQERGLIARVLVGDRAASRELYDAHATRIYRLIHRMAGDEELARDFTQDTFLRAFRHLAEFRGDSSVSTWLHSIAVSVTLNGLRRERRHRSRELDISEADDIGEIPVIAEPDLKERLFKAIDALDDIYRPVVIMHDMEGYTHSEIGAILGIPEGTSKARLSAARTRLREALLDFVRD